MVKEFRGVKEMKDFRKWNENKNNLRDLECHYDYSSPINYFGSILIQNEKRKWNQGNQG